MPYTDFGDIYRLSKIAKKPKFQNQLQIKSFKTKMSNFITIALYLHSCFAGYSRLHMHICRVRESVLALWHEHSFKEPNATRSRQSDLIGLSRTAPDAPTLRGLAHHIMAFYSIINCAKASLVVVGFIVVFVV